MNRERADRCLGRWQDLPPRLVEGGAADPVLLGAGFGSVGVVVAVDPDPRRRSSAWSSLLGRRQHARDLPNLPTTAGEGGAGHGVPRPVLRSPRLDHRLDQRPERGSRGRRRGRTGARARDPRRVELPRAWHHRRRRRRGSEPIEGQGAEHERRQHSDSNRGRRLTLSPFGPGPRPDHGVASTK